MIRVITAVSFLGILFSSCMIEQKLVLQDNLTGNWQIKSTTMPFAIEVFDDLAIVGGYSGADVLIDETMSKSSAELNERDDIDEFKLIRTNKLDWQSEIKFTNLESLLGEPDRDSIARFSNKGNLTKLELRFNHELASGLETLFPIMQESALAIFSPNATAGIDEETYIKDFLGFTFGQKNIPAIRKSRIAMTVEVPGTIVEIVSGKKISHNQARFEVRLSRFMVPADEILWSISWK